MNEPRWDPQIIESFDQDEQAKRLANLVWGMLGPNWDVQAINIPKEALTVNGQEIQINAGAAIVAYRPKLNRHPWIFAFDPKPNADPWKLAIRLVELIRRKTSNPVK